MTNPLGGPPGTDSYERQLGPLSDVGKQEWDQFLQRRQELIDAFLGSAQGAAHAVDIPTTVHPIGPPQTPGGLEGMKQDESRRDLLARADFWRIPNADQLSTQDLQTQLAAKRAEVKMAPQTTPGTVASAFGGATEEGVSAAARLTGNLLQNVVGDAPFIGETLGKILQIDKAKNWLYNWSSKLDESAQVVQGQQPAQDKSAAQFLTAAGKTAGYVLPAMVAWEGIGAAGAGMSLPGWLARASTPLTRLAVRGALTSAVLDDPLASPGEKAMNLGMGAVLGASQVWGRLGLAVGGAALGAGVGSGVGDTPEERQRNQILGGIGGAVLGGLAPMAAAALTKTRDGFPSPLDQKIADAEYTRTTGTTGAIPTDQSGGRQPLTEDVIAPEFLGEPRQVSGNPPPKQLHGPNGQLGTVNTAEDLAALIRSEPTRSIGPSGQLEVGAQGTALDQPKVAGLLPAQTNEGSIAHDDHNRLADALMNSHTAIEVLHTYTPDPTDLHSLNFALDVARGVVANPAKYLDGTVARAREVLESVPSRIDAKVYDYQRNAPPEAKGLASVTNGPGHLIGSKVAAADGSPLRVYHGTGVDFEAFDPQAADGGALYGPGFYHTESPEIAAGYAGDLNPYNPPMGADPLTYNPRPNLRPAFLDIKRPFDIEAKYEPQEIEQLLTNLERSHPEYQWDEARKALTDPNAATDESGLPRGSGPTNGDDLYNVLANTQLQSGIQHQGPEQAPVGNWMTLPVGSNVIGKAGLNQALEALGYDGITHIGGARTGNDPHRVWVAFRPEQVHMPWQIDPMATGEAIGTAESITKQATVMESASLPDAMGKPGVTDSDVISAMKATNPGGVSVLRNVGRPLEALLEHPDINFVERDGKLDAFVGESTPEMRDDYKRWGTYESQIVVTPKGQEGTVISINSKGIATLARSGGGPPLRLKASNLLPSRFGQPVRQAPDLWDSFKGDLLSYMNTQANKLGMQPVDGIFDSRVGDVMQHHLDSYLDRRGINDPAERHAIDAYMNQRYVEEARDLDPESRDLQARTTDAATAAQNAVADDEIISTEELAAPKGFVWIREPGTSGGILRDNLNPDSGLEIPMKESDVPEFLRTVDRTAPDLTPTATVPVDVMESVPTDTATEPRAGIEETIDNAADAGWRKFAKESVPLRQFGAEHAQAMRDNFASTTKRIEDIIAEGDRQRAEAAAARMGGGGQPPELPPQDVSGEGFDPWPRRLPGEDENASLGDQFAELKKSDLPKYMELGEKYKNVLFRYTRYLMAGLEKDLVGAGVDMGRAWKHYEAIESARSISDNHAHPWLGEYGDIMRDFDSPILRDGTVTKIHEIEDTSERMAEFAKLMDRGYSQDEVEGFIQADDKLTDFNHRWFQFLTEDPSFALTGDREIFRYMSHVRARQAQGVVDPFDSTGYLSPNTQYFAEFAREGNLQFRVMDARELGNYMIRAGMFKKYQAEPWQDLVDTWSDSRVPEPIRNLMLDHARAMKFGYDASGDMAVKGIQLVLDKVLGLKTTSREAQQILAAPVSGMYMSMLAGRTSIFFRDAIQPLMALAKVQMNHLAGVYGDVLNPANRQPLQDMYERGLKGGWILHEAPKIEGLGLFEEQGGLRQNELLGLTPEQTARRELMAALGDKVNELPAWLARPTESNLSTLKWYGKQQQLQRAIVGEAAYRQADVALDEYRHSEMMAALSKDPSVAVPYQEFAKQTFFSSFEEPIANRLKELVEGGQDEEAKMMFAREVANWSQFKYGRREQPAIVRSNFGRILYSFGNFSGQFAEQLNSGFSNGEPMHKARYGMVLSAVSAALAYAGAKTGWSFGKWAWGSALKYAGGPGVDALAQLGGAIGGAVSLSDDRKPSPFQNEALKAEAGQSLLPDPMSFFPYAGYVRSAAEYSAAAQGTNPAEQALRYTITGDRGSRIDNQRSSQQRADELTRAIEQRGVELRNQVESRGLNQDASHGSRVGPPILRNPAYAPTNPGYPDSIPGLVQRGNIDLMHRPVVKNSDGSISTVRSISVGFGSREVLLPTVSPDGRILTTDQAIQLFRQTGQHLGMFSSVQAANAYAQRLHQNQARQYLPPHPGGGALQ